MYYDVVLPQTPEPSNLPPTRSSRLNRKTHQTRKLIAHRECTLGTTYFDDTIGAAFNIHQLMHRDHNNILHLHCSDLKLIYSSRELYCSNCFLRFATHDMRILHTTSSTALNFSHNLARRLVTLNIVLLQQTTFQACIRKGK